MTPTTLRGSVSHRVACTAYFGRQGLPQPWRVSPTDECSTLLTRYHMLFRSTESRRHSLRLPAWAAAWLR